MAALAAAAPLVAYPALVSEREPGALWSLGVAALVLGLAGMASSQPMLVGLALATLAVEFGIASDELGWALDTRAVVWGAGLLLFAELAFLSLELRTSVIEGGDLVARRLGTIVGLLVGSVVVGSLLLAVAAIEPPGGLALQVVGVVAAAGALALIMSLVRR